MANLYIKLVSIRVDCVFIIILVTFTIQHFARALKYIHFSSGLCPHSDEHSVQHYLKCSRNNLLEYPFFHMYNLQLFYTHFSEEI